MAQVNIEYVFSETEIENWHVYEALRKSGLINMFDVRQGCQLTGLNRAEYMFCMENYEALEDWVK